jgi:hypothetical protein
VEALNLHNFGWFMRSFRDVMDRLATDLMCYTVETLCFEERLAEAMLRIKAQKAGWLMRWQVEGLADGQHQNS